MALKASQKELDQAYLAQLQVHLQASSEVLKALARESVALLKTSATLASLNFKFLTHE